MELDHIALLQHSFEKLSVDPEETALLFYARLFELDPSLRPMFKGDLTEQKQKLMHMLTVVVRGLKRLDQLAPAVQQLGRKHGGYGVQASHYQTVGAALLWTLEQGLGPDFTPEVKAAWVAAYTILATTMQAAAAAAAQADTAPGAGSRGADSRGRALSPIASRSAGRGAQAPSLPVQAAAHTARGSSCIKKALTEGGRPGLAQISPSHPRL